MIAQFFHGSLMKSFFISCIGLLGLSAISLANANDFEAALSQDTAQFTFRSDSSLIGWGGSDLAFGLFYNDESDFIVQASLLPYFVHDNSPLWECSCCQRPRRAVRAVVFVLGEGWGLFFVRELGFRVTAGLLSARLSCHGVR